MVTLGSSEPPFGTYAPGNALGRMIATTRRLPSGKVGRRLGRFMRSWLSRSVNHPVDLEVFGQHMRLHPRGNACERNLILTPHHFDSEELELLSRRLHPRFVFIDIGANVGAYSLFIASKAGAAAQILAVEPHPIVAERLEFNLASNGLATVKVIRCALSDKQGEAELHAMPWNLGTSTIRAGARPHLKATGFKVPTDTLLGVVEAGKLDHIDAVKLDIEGVEDLVLSAFYRDAPPALWPGIVILENRPQRWERDLFGLLKQSGYQAVMTTRDNVVFERGTAGVA